MWHLCDSCSLFVTAVVCDGLNTLSLSTILNATGKGFVVDRGYLLLNHLLHLDDLKLFAKSRNELDSLVKTVKLFSDVIHMQFGII